jgi:hypothetical protein
MATASLAHTAPRAALLSSVTRSNVARAVAAARAACANRPYWLNAVNRAVFELEVGHWAFDGTVLLIASSTAPRVRYTVDASGCTCKAGKAGKPCKHRAAWRLLINAAAHAA